MQNKPLIVWREGLVINLVSNGIGCLVGAHISRENAGRQMILVGANERLRTSLKVTKVDELFVTAATLEEAVSKAAGH